MNTKNQTQACNIIESMLSIENDRLVITISDIHHEAIAEGFWSRWGVVDGAAFGLPITAIILKGADASSYINAPFIASRFDIETVKEFVSGDPRLISIQTTSAEPLDFVIEGPSLEVLKKSLAKQLELIVTKKDQQTIDECLSSCPVTTLFEGATTFPCVQL